jgi:hypothetical protein
MADLNIVNVSDIKGRTLSANLTNSTANVVINTFGQSKTFKVNNVLFANRSANICSVYLNFVDHSNGSNAFPLIFNLDVPQKASVEALAKPLYLEEGDRLMGFLLSPTGGSVDSGNVIVTISYEELS